MRQPKNDIRNDKGFTLVELLIAVVILAIVVTPLLNAFVVSTKVNTKSRETLRATSAAQNIMEGFKANDLADLALQFNYPTTRFEVIDSSAFTGGLPTDVKELLKVDSGGVISYNNVIHGIDKETTTSSIYSTDAGNHYEFLGQASGEYYFGLKGIKMENTVYDALIHLSAAAYRSTGPSTNQKYNDDEIVSFSYPDALQDAFYVQSLTLETEVLDHFKTLFPAHEFSKNYLSRIIDITIITSAIINGISEVSIKYTYNYSDSEIPLQTYTLEHVIYNNSESHETLRSVYLFYTPLYNSVAGNIKDVINIVNDDNMPVTVNIVKQETGDQATMSSSEMNYKMQLNVKENTLSSVTKAYLDLRTNLDWNLYSVYQPEGYNGTLQQGTYSYNSHVGNQDEIKAILKFNGLSGLEKKDSLYDVVVSIYKDGAAIANYPDNQKITSITGSMND